MSRRGLQVLVLLFGAVAVVFGSLGVVAGVDGVLDGGSATASLDSEFRYFAAWYVCAGVLLLKSARHVETEGVLLRVIAGALFLGALGRLFSFVEVGRPSTFAVVLMSIEFTVAVVVVLWQLAVARRDNDVARA